MAHSQVILVNLVRVFKRIDVELLLFIEVKHLFCGCVEDLALELNIDEFEVRGDLDGDLQVVAGLDLQAVEGLGRGDPVDEVLGFDVDLDVLDQV